jgi:hypothetical protein
MQSNRYAILYLLHPSPQYLPLPLEADTRSPPDLFLQHSEEVSSHSTVQDANNDEKVAVIQISDISNGDLPFHPSQRCLPLSSVTEKQSPYDL